MSVSIASVRGAYSQTPPFHPSRPYPEYNGAVGEEENPGYEGVREAMRLLGLDLEHFGDSIWNPLGHLIEPGQTVFIKPNMVDHKHRFDDEVWSVITHPSVVRAIADYAAIALKGRGRIIVGDNPHVDTMWREMSRLWRFDLLQDDFAKRWPDLEVEFVDLRKWHMPNLDYYGFKHGREEIPGDPLGEALIDVGEHSLFADVPVHLFRGTYNDRSETIRHHRRGHHLYSFSKTMIESDVFISVPKLKAHAKVGVTLNLKGLIGTIINKNCLVHWRIGYPELGGDEYPTPVKWRDYPKLYAQHLLRDITPSRLYFVARNLARSTRFYEKFYEPIIRTENQKRRMLRGAWEENDTTWRMTVDVYNAFVRDITSYRRERGIGSRFFSFVDGIMGGDTDGPHFPHPTYPGLLLAGEDLLEVDLVSTRVMDFSIETVKYLDHLRRDLDIPLEDVEVISEWVDGREFFDPRREFLKYRPPHRWPSLSLHGIQPGPSFLPLR